MISISHLRHFQRPSWSITMRFWLISTKVHTCFLLMNTFQFFWWLLMFGWWSLKGSLLGDEFWENWCYREQNYFFCILSMFVNLLRCLKFPLVKIVFLFQSNQNTPATAVCDRVKKSASSVILPRRPDCHNRKQVCYF